MVNYVIVPRLLSSFPIVKSSFSPIFMSGLPIRKLFMFTWPAASHRTTLPCHEHHWLLKKSCYKISGGWCVPMAPLDPPMISITLYLYTQAANIFWFFTIFSRKQETQEVIYTSYVLTFGATTAVILSITSTKISFFLAAYKEKCFNCGNRSQRTKRVKENCALWPGSQSN